MATQEKKLLVGTGKGLLLWQKEAGSWKLNDIFFRGMPVSMLYVDPRHADWWVGLSHKHWGQKLHVSRNQGKSWEHIPMPQYPASALLSNGQPANLKRIWIMEQGGADQPEKLWMGTEPGGLFLSEDRGRHFSLVESLWNHPSRSDENQWFGAGRDHPFIHSISVNPTDSHHLYLAVSCAGVFESKDGGQSWNPKNQGLIAAYLPNPHVEVGHDPHRLLMSPSHPEVLWQQNHCGVFRSADAGLHWDNVSDTQGLADYGFALAIDEQDPLKAWLIPAESDEERVPKDLRLRVSMTQDGGKSWQVLAQGLPEEASFGLAFRHGLVKSGADMAFGTNNGNLFVSTDEGQHWEAIHHHLARIDVLAFA
ncbi:MAG: glycosyl hydrolase [Bacteroidota bacterium]